MTFSLAADWCSSSNAMAGSLMLTSSAAVCTHFFCFHVVIFRQKQVRRRHRRGWGGEGCRVCGGTKADLYVAGFPQLKNLRLWAELATGILVDQHRPAT